MKGDTFVCCKLVTAKKNKQLFAKSLLLLVSLSFLIISKPVSKYNSDGTLLSFPNIKPKAILGEWAFVFAAPNLWNASRLGNLGSLRNHYGDGEDNVDKK